MSQVTKLFNVLIEHSGKLEEQPFRTNFAIPFRYADHNGDGKVTHEELWRLFKQNRQPKTDKEIAEIINKYDANGKLVINHLTHGHNLEVKI